MQANQFHLLKTRRFLPLFITQFLGAFNDNVFKNALVILITYKIATVTDINAQLFVTMAAGLFILPFFLFSATAGQLADKFPKSKLMVIVKLIEIMIMMFAIFAFTTENVNWLMAVLFLLGTQATFFGPAKYAILPEQLHEKELIAGNGLIEAGTFISILLGTILGGSLILLPGGIYLVSATILAIAIAGFISSLYVPKSQAEQPTLKIKWNILTETFRLMGYASERTDLFLCILGISWFWLVGATFLAEFPVFVKEILFANEHVVTFFFAIFSLGIALGSLVCNRLLKGQISATYVPLGALGITLFGLDLFFASGHAQAIAHDSLMTLNQFITTTVGWRISFDLLCIAIAGGIYTVPLYAILQRRSEPEHRARIIASNNIMNALFMVVAAIATLIMLKIGLSIRYVFLLVALANAFVVVYICKLLPDALLKAGLIWLLKFIYRVRVVGLENYYQAGERVIIIANHTSFLDAALLSVFLPDKLTYAIDTFTAKKWWVKPFLRFVDAHKVNPTNPMALKSIIEVIKRNRRCVIFPEGRLTVTGALMKIYEGPGLIADKSGAKLLPIRIEGAQYTHFSRLKGKVRLRWAPTITLTIFPAQTLDISDDIKGRKRRLHIGNKLYDLMTEMMFEGSDYKQTLFSSLIDAKSTHGRRHKIVEDIERNPTTYQQFITRSFILGNILAKRTYAGENVGILLPNTVTTALTFFALQAYCRVPAMLNFSTGINNVVQACKTAKIKTVFTSLKFVRLIKLTDMINALKAEGVNVVYLENLRSSVNAFHKLKGLLYAQFPRLAYKWVNIGKAKRHLLDPEAAAVVLFTSGSEGTPKGVVLSHKNLQANRMQLSACIDFTPSDKAFNALPVFHSFGLTGGMLLPMLSGVSVFFYPSPLHYRIVPELSYDTNATILFGTDTFLTGYANYAHQYDFYSIRYIFAGAEKLRDETRATWAQKFGVRIFEGYGTSETSPVLATNMPMKNKPGTVGRLLPGIKYKLREVPGIDEGGVLVVSGPNIMKGYLKAENPGELLPPEEGWYDTGDVVTVDEEGYVTIKGRVKRFAKIGGEMVSLAMIEQYINTLWPNFQHAVINIPDARKGEQIVLVTTFVEATREAVVGHAKANRIGEIAIPKKIIHMETLPLLGTGKVDYVALKKLVAEIDS